MRFKCAWISCKPLSGMVSGLQFLGYHDDHNNYVHLSFQLRVASFLAKYPWQA